MHKSKNKICIFACICIFIYSFLTIFEIYGTNNQKIFGLFELPQNPNTYINTYIDENSLLYLNPEIDAFNDKEIKVLKENTSFFEQNKNVYFIKKKEFDLNSIDIIIKDSESKDMDTNIKEQYKKSDIVLNSNFIVISNPELYDEEINEKFNITTTDKKNFNFNEIKIKPLLEGLEKDLKYKDIYKNNKLDENIKISILTSKNKELDKTLKNHYKNLFSKILTESDENISEENNKRIENILNKCQKIDVENLEKKDIKIDNFLIMPTLYKDTLFNKLKNDYNFSPIIKEYNYNISFDIYYKINSKINIEEHFINQMEDNLNMESYRHDKFINDYIYFNLNKNRNNYNLSKYRDIYPNAIGNELIKPSKDSVKIEKVDKNNEKLSGADIKNVQSHLFDIIELVKMLTTVMAIIMLSVGLFLKFTTDSRSNLLFSGFVLFLLSLITSLITNFL